ncbi:MAG TPA: hypothetical protein VN634_16150 [Candidatus Limnocylindrales bacterium]|nr:hypothetical protein [Candidatus Limnocylindrales bacterium]
MFERLRAEIRVFPAAMLIAAVALFLPGAGIASSESCGKPQSAGQNPAASDCLYILRAAVSDELSCPLCLCDVNASGGVTASDALGCLQAAVGQPVTLTCPPCDQSTTTSTTTTTTTIDSCPTVIALTTHAGYGAACASNGDCAIGECDGLSGRCHTSSELDIGWITSQSDWNDGSTLRLRTECGSDGPPCGQCSVTDVDASAGNCRCTSLGFATLPGRGNQQICDVPFQHDVPACLECEDAGQKNTQGCNVADDCLDTNPQCKNVKVCTNSPDTVCTSSSVCTAISAEGTCAARVCSNEHLTACGANSDCAEPTAKCQSQKCSNDKTHTCSTNTDCQVGVCNPQRLHCSTQGSSEFCTTNEDCFIHGTCTGHGDCACYTGAPLPISAGGVPFCVLTRFANPVVGTVDVDEGSVALTENLRMLVFLGQSGSGNSCPTCGGLCSTNADAVCNRDLDCPGGTCTHLDPISGDGQRGGVCTAGQNIKLPCDVTAANTTFPAFIDGPNGGGYSLDCFPSAGKNATGTGLLIDLTQTTGTSTLTAHVPCGQVDALCPCLICNGNRTEDVPCNTDQYCADLGFGTCSSSGSGGFPEPNVCENSACSALPDGTGECTTGPDEFFCDDLVRANGKGIVPCDPTRVVDERGCGKPSDGVFYYGNCTLSQRRLCLPDPIVATGEVDPQHPVLASTACMPPTSGAGKNAVLGIPGPLRLLQQTTMQSFCDAAAGKRYAPGVGCAAEPGATIP